MRSKMNKTKKIMAGIIYNLEKENACQSAREAKTWLEQQNVKVNLYGGGRVVAGFHEKEIRIDPETDFCIVFGGDGTFLYAARKLAPLNIPLLCVNTGTLGFLSAISLQNIYKGLQLVLDKKYYIQERLMLYVYVVDKNSNKTLSTFYALNDAVISKGAIARLIKLVTYIDGSYVTTYNADGLIISTPTGSTAYALSSGGPILTPTVSAIILAPICPHTLSLRPLVVSDICCIKINLSLDYGTKDVVLTIDGQELFELNSDHDIFITKSPYMAKLIKFQEEEDFFYTLQTKLQWGIK